MKDKNFILGVGCQKGGTTWLYSQLNNCINTDMGFTKEYHIFDALYMKESKGLLERNLQKFSEIAQAPAKLSQKDHNLLKQITFYLDTSNYYDYFDYLWYRSGPEVTTVGDITPAYSALPTACFQKIKTNLEAKGFNVKVIFLMRDPIERCWSMIRMKNRLNRVPTQNKVTGNGQKQLRQAYKTKQCQNRTRYELTIKNLESVFNSQNIFYGFYETLFEDTTLNRLKEFLNLSHFSPDVTHKTNVSPKGDKKLNEALARKIFDFYKDTYLYCDERFGTQMIWSGWAYATSETRGKEVSRHLA